MFKKRRLMFVDDPFEGAFDSTNAGAGSGSPQGADEESGYDFASFGSPDPEENSGQPAEQASEATNPAWTEYLKDIPDTMHRLVTPAFKKWDQNVAAKFEQHAQAQKRYEKYNEFVENEVDPDAIRAGIHFLQQMSSDPVAFYKELDAAIRSDPALAAALSPEEKKNVADAAGTGTDQDNIEDPYQQQLAQLKAEQDKIRNAFSAEHAERQKQAEIAEATQEFERDFQTIEGQYGSLSPQFKNQIVRQAMAMEASERRPIGMIEAFESLREFGEAYARTKKKAPRVIGGGGSQQARHSVENPGKMTEEDRRKAVLAIVNEHKGN